MINDLRLATRTLLRSPGFAIAAALTIAIGVGANATIFGVVDAVLLKALPFREPERLVALYEVTQAGEDRMPLSPANFKDWSERSHSFSGMSVVYTASATLDGGQGAVTEPQRLQVARASGNLVQVLGVVPALGRAFTADDAQPGREPVILLGWQLWQRAFAGDTDVVGRVVRLDGQAYTVLGVLPRDVRWPENATQAWLPNQNDARWWETRGNHSLTGVARLAPGVSMAQAQAELRRVAAGVNAEHEDMHKGWSARHVPLLEATVGGARQVLLVLLGAVSFVLLIGCANVTNLALARASGRRRDVAVRSALGARTRHLLRLYLAESVVIGAAGGALGLLLAHAAMAAIPAIAPAEILRLDQAHVDWRVGGFALVLAVLASFTSAAWPALVAARGSVATTMRDGGRNATGGKARARGRDLLFVAEVALALVLLAGAGIAVRSLTTLLSVDPGFRPERVLAASLSLPRARYESDTLRSGFVDAALASVRARPGVRGAAFVSNLPLGGDRARIGFWVEGRPELDGNKVPLADESGVSEGYFDVMGIPLLRGRDFAATDRLGGAPVVVVNQSLAQKVFPGQDALGRRLMPFGPEGPKFTIVGIVGDALQGSLGDEPTMQLYIADRQFPSRDGAVVVRGGGEPATLASALREGVRAVDPLLALNQVRPMRDVVMASVARPRFATLLLGAFAGFALLLAIVGIYGVVSHGVSQRAGEFGIRAALGAKPGDLLRGVLAGALARAGAGVAIGLVATLALSRLLASQLPGARATDPVVMLGVAALLGSVALVASWIPARRATRASPLSALRAE